MPDMEQMAAVYRRIRDARSAATKEYEAKDKELKAKLDTVGNAMLKWLNDNKIDSIGVTGASVYRELDVMPTIADDKALFAWIKENDAFDAFQRRLKVGFFVDYLKAHAGETPPGVNIYKKWKVVVRKSDKLTDPEDDNE